AVGDGHAAEDGAHRAVRVEPVQRAGAGAGVVGHRTAVEAAVRVAAALVHPQSVVTPHVAEVPQRTIGLLECEAALHGDDRAAPLTGTDDGGDVTNVPAFDGAVRAE